MPMVATKAPYTLVVSEDDMADNPREDSVSGENAGNFGKMVCWHSRYDLGDKHDFDEPRDFLQQTLSDMYSTQGGKPVYDYIKAGKAAEAKLEYNRSTREWELLENNTWSSGGDWYASSSYPASLKGKDVPDWFLDDCLSALKSNEMLELLEQSGQFAILPLYLYDHSGITMSAGSFSCLWDSGQVGWIYGEGIEKEYGAVTPETLETAKRS